jgi:hypothetical protein
VAANDNLSLSAEDGLFKFQSDVLAQIGPTLCPAAASTASAENVPETEEIAEDVAEVLEYAWVKAGGTTSTNGGVAVAVIGRALFAVSEDCVGLAALLELFLRVGIVGIPVRMILQRELAIGALDFLVGSGAGDTEDLVIIAFSVTRQNGIPILSSALQIHRQRRLRALYEFYLPGFRATLTIAGRNRRSLSL